MTQSGGSDRARAARAALVADDSLHGRAFGRALARVIDDELLGVLSEIGDDRIAVLALGSYARAELCPGSDLDVLLLHDGRPDLATVADALWYPLWDAGFVLGNATRTVKESVKLAETDLETLTTLLDARLVGGALQSESGGLVTEVRTLAQRRRGALIAELAERSTLRRRRPGPIAEMLEPNLKDGAGGLRDLQALAWAGAAFGAAGGTAALIEAEFLRPGDAPLLERAGSLLLDTRVALHRVTGGRSDVLALQDQDGVALGVGATDADTLVRDLAAGARNVAWIADDAWTRMQESPRRSDRAGPRGGRRRNRGTGDQAVLVEAGLGIANGRLVVGDDAVVDGALVLRAARVAAERPIPIDRGALTRLRDAGPPRWSTSERDDFLALLRTGAGAIAVFEALDHEDLITGLLPEWENVRFRPQRNAYHRFTVDRHLLETVVEAVVLLDDPREPEARPADGLEVPELLLLGALLHDIAKGRPGDHATLGAETAREIGERIGLPEDQVDTLEWLVRDHLLMADTASRRDLADSMTIDRFSERVGDPQRLRLLTLLTVADSRATGPAAWGPGKAVLVRELYDRTLAGWEGRRPVAERSATVAAPELSGPGIVVVWSLIDGDRLQCAVGAPDRPGLLAGVAGALSIEGFDIDAAEAQTLPGGRAAEVFIGTDRFGRLADDAGRERASTTIRQVLTGEVSVVDGLRERRAAYAHVVPDAGTGTEAEVRVVQDESENATVVEVFASDEFGLLATVAGVFGELGLDVTVAKVATTGERAVDIFYVRDGETKVTDAVRLAGLRSALLAALRRD